MPGDKKPIVAIDGPVGAGKSTVSKEVSRRLGFGFVDTGACYRCIALTSLKQQVDPADDEKLKKIVEGVEIRFDMTEDGINHVYCNGVEVTTDIRKEEVSLQASRTSKNQVVRDGLMGLQRRLGNAGGVVLEGRDIGTVVFPDADVKIFLTADEKVRAQRRFDELVAKGETPEFEQVCCFVLFCFVLFCFVLFCFVLFCFVLFCFVLFCFVLFCFVLFCFVLFCFVLFCFVLFCFVLFCFVLFCFVLFCFVLFCFVLFCFVLFCFVLFCFVLFCFVLFCFVLFCFVLFCFVLFCFVLFCFVLFCFVLFCFVLFCFVLFCFVLFCFVFLSLAAFVFLPHFP